MNRVNEADLAQLRASGAFDPEWYLETYPDVRQSNLEPAEHYLWIGARLGRRGSATMPCGEEQVWAARPSANDLPQARTYAQWLAHYDFDENRDGAAARAWAAQLAVRPLISIIMPTYNTPAVLLCEAIDSVITQVYQDWELCIADDLSTDPEVRERIAAYAARDARIRPVFRHENGNISEASNSAISMARGDWLAFFDHDDVLRPHALLMVAEWINRFPHLRLLYSDEDKLTVDGERDGPYMKCDWNYHLFLSHNLITHLSIYRRDLLEEVGGLRKEFDGAQDYDLALRCTEVLRPEEIGHIPFVLYSWRMTPGSTALNADEKPYAMIAGERALKGHFSRRNINARAELVGFGYRTHYEIPVPSPLVSIIIPTHNAENIVRICVESIVNRTTYDNYEIILVDNRSDDPESIAYFKEVEVRHGVKILSDPRPFNFSAINNRAVQYARGDVVLFLNNDTEVIAPDWLEIMVGLAIQPDVGSVGARLLYPDRTVQHAGVIMGLGGLAAHAHTGFPFDSPGYSGRLALANEFSAMTAACLAVRRTTFLAAGGFDEESLTVAYNDVDLGLKLSSRGLRNVYAPQAMLLHYESATRGAEDENPEKAARFRREQGVMIARWKRYIDHDPAYSPNLSLDNCNFELAFPPRVDLPWRGPVIT